ncbi:hypothetical protein VTO73DRAFT_2593 [Trametes versicolor]
MASTSHNTTPLHFVGRLGPASFGAPAPREHPARNRVQQQSHAAEDTSYNQLVSPSTAAAFRREASVVSYAEPVLVDEENEDPPVAIQRRSPSPSLTLARVQTRFRALPLSELILPEHLHLRGRRTWKTYKHAIETVFKLKGLQGHLERTDLWYQSEPTRWNEEQRLCRAIITLNIHDIERLRPENGEHAVDYWERLTALHEGTTALRELQAYKMNQNIDIPGLFLPAHLRLGQTNWHEYRHAVETICRLHGVDENLEFSQPWVESPNSTSDERVKERDEWFRREDLCKAIVTLNIRDFPRFGIQAGWGSDANKIWRGLVEMHTKKRRCWEGLFAWVRPLTGLEKLLLFIVLALLWHLFMVASELRGERSELTKSTMRMHRDICTEPNKGKHLPDGVSGKASKVLSSPYNSPTRDGLSARRSLPLRPLPILYSQCLPGRRKLCRLPGRSPMAFNFAPQNHTKLHIALMARTVLTSTDPAASWSRAEAKRIAERAFNSTKSAHGEDVDWREKLNRDDTFASVRDVKNTSANFKVMYPRNHAFARYVLPVAESEIKEQEWPGKKHDDKTPPSTTTSASSISSGMASSDEQKSVDEEHEIEDEAKEPELSDEQRAFIDKLLAEMDMVASFKNNPGRPIGELKLLDHDALQQLESRLSIDDQSTPDSWIPRSAELLRLTGKHPLNAEANLSRLFEAGMITPTKLHYVRSHGSVPQLTWETHTLSVFSDPLEIIAKPKDWTMDELSSGNLKVVEMPITFGCDGNRRKEMNMIKKTSAFHWSAASMSTCLWRGVLVRDVLLACGLQDQPDEERWYLNFAGADEPSEGPYETSIPLMHAMNPANDVMLVFGMNGRVLHPDHGYPLRLIIPGYVGGRQVKWLKKIWVTKEPNRSHYHIWDNRVVPSFIDSREHPYANAFFHHESTACWEQALQSAIVKPAHGECIPLSGKRCLDGTYLLEGYAYGGGGDRVERVEVSLDGGKTWKYCFRRFTDSPLRHGEKYWAWIFWSCEVKIQELVDAYEIIVRAQDSRKNYQAENISWNLMGMMNNAWYRVRHRVVQDEETALPVLQFQHPVAPGNDEGGWMKPPIVEESASKRNENLKTFSLEEISKHSTKDDAWLILDNKVYDVTSVLSWHPGGANAILSYAGKATVDVTNEYKGIHDNYANGKRDECLIGMLSDEGIKAMEEDAVRAAKELAKIKAERHGAALQPDVFTLAKLVNRKELSSDTRVYTFELPRQKDGSPGVLGLPVGRHVQISVHFKDQAVLRSYTPTRPVLPSEEDGTFDLLVKTYLPSPDSPFPPGGTVSNYLDCMKEGEEIDIRGPSGGITYKGHGDFDIEGIEYHFDKVNLVAGGSGLTPHWQLVHAVLMDPSDNTLVSLIDSNKTYDDILMRDELQKYAEEHSDRFKIWHVISDPPKEKINVKFTEGRLNKDIMEEHFYPAADNVAAFLCGPPGLIEKAAIPGLKEMGFEDGRTIFGY